MSEAAWTALLIVLLCTYRTVPTSCLVREELVTSGNVMVNTAGTVTPQVVRRIRYRNDMTSADASKVIS